MTNATVTNTNSVLPPVLVNRTGLMGRPDNMGDIAALMKGQMTPDAFYQAQLGKKLGYTPVTTDYPFGKIEGEANVRGFWSVDGVAKCCWIAAVENPDGRLHYYTNAVVPFLVMHKGDKAGPGYAVSMPTLKPVEAGSTLDAVAGSKVTFHGDRSFCAGITYMGRDLATSVMGTFEKIALQVAAANGDPSRTIASDLAMVRCLTTQLAAKA